ASHTPRATLTPRTAVPRVARVPFEAEVAAALDAAVATESPLDFEGWALRIFRHQFEHVPAYRRFCERRGVTPTSVARWDDVPAVPPPACRTAALATGPAEATFRTSGTSGGPDARGRHAIPHLDLYRASALPTFARHLLPDAVRLPFLVLLPPPAERPDSSLVHMCAWVADAFGTRVDWLAGPTGLDVERACARLDDFASSGDAV